MNEIERFKKALGFLESIYSLSKEAVADAFVQEKDHIERYKMMAISCVAFNALLQLDPRRADELNEMIAWAQKEAQRLGLEQVAQDVLGS